MYAIKKKQEERCGHRACFPLGLSYARDRRYPVLQVRGDIEGKVEGLEKSFSWCDLRLEKRESMMVLSVEDQADLLQHLLLTLTTLSALVTI